MGECASCHDGRMDALSLSLVLPCFNEELNAELTVREALAWFDTERIGGVIIAVDDGSTDRTRAILQSLSAKDPRVRVLFHDVNQGYGAAIRTGCDVADQEYIAFVDSDGQFRIRDLRLLLAHCGTYAFVAGRRRTRADSFVRNTLGKILGLMNWIVLGLWVRDANCGMKVFRRDLWSVIRPTYGIEKMFNTELFLRLKQARVRWFQVDVPHYPRRAGNPTGAKLYVIGRMLKELWGLRRIRNQAASPGSPARYGAGN